ncbi:long-chain-fatty-acid--CoA ligase [Aeromicrobium wangtongii]|uniref:Long-chain-fatty-acid--CoA ligase n=1 Tax=Aeromicrobium wangtongii TaxID=2969247 RepID=A0ABY5MAS0_9ACTN|nr:long-chain-fatty-acid--CoA ligase [Aeromicrobium wangtongii]MCD9199705.1 long-chain-fatty-acid--CoA ligase [Aeromicrobium wangtongii]UUP14054.1 long-chain-fatty-acid--CoA ligase [Aeromicrobium wangtongii]
MSTTPAATFLPDFLAARAAERPDDLCWVFGERRWTWSQAWESVRHAAGALQAEGVHRGDRVAFLDKNNPAILQVLLGGSLLGVATTVVNWRLAGDELDYVINDCGARVLFVGHHLADQLELVRDRLEHVERIVVVGGEHDEYDAWLAAGPATDRQDDVSPEDVCVVMYSSGTTGRPKGVQLTQHAMIEHSLNGSGDTTYTDGDMMLVAMPMFHVGGASYALLGPALGVPAYIVSEVDATLMAGGIMAGCTHAFLVPAVIAALVAAGPQAMALFGRLKAVGYGAAPMPPPVLRAALEAWPDTEFQQVYGMTEFGGVITVLDDAAHRDPDHPERLVSAGLPVPKAEMRIVDPTTLRDVPTGASGEVWFRTPQATIGYLGRPDATAELITEDGWVRTGDLGRVDEDGFLFIEDRLKDMIITGGENVYSPEVERVLAEHPAVAEIAIIGVPDDRWGETVKAVVAFKPDQSASAAELIAFARERLAGFKVPASIDVVEALPRNPSGKILKRELRKPYWGDSARQV